MKELKKYGWKLNTSGRLGNNPRKRFNLEHYFNRFSRRRNPIMLKISINEKVLPYSGFVLPYNRCCMETSI